MKEKIKEYMEALVEDGVFPGANYAIYYHGITVMDSVGKRSLFPYPEENNLDTIYDIASLTKVLVTNVLLAYLEEEGKIDFQDSYQKYFPYFRYPNVTLEHLLTHSSGLVPKYDKNNLVRKDEFFEKIEAKNQPGEDVIYSDLNYILLGFLIEKLEGKSLDILAQEKIFKPLHMKDTTFLPTDKMRCAPTEEMENRGIVRGEVHDEKAYFLNGVAGHAGVFATVQDFFLFMRAILEGKIPNLSKKAIDRWFQVLATSKTGVSRSHSWMLASTYKDTKSFVSSNAILHTGFTGNECIIDRDNEYLFLLLSNRVHPTRENTKLIDRRKEMNETIYHIVKEG